jgi:hypothetical protein
LYKRLPVSWRSQIHLLIHRLNANRFLLWSLQFRHYFTCKRLKKISHLKLRVGESYKYQGWISTNYQVFCWNFLDVTKPLSGLRHLELIIADNVIEHLTLEQGKTMLQNLFDAMSAGAILRLSTPDLRGLVLRYMNGNADDLEQFRVDLQQHNVHITFPPDLLRVPFTAFGHSDGYLYDFDTLKLLLTNIGFVNIRQELTSVSTNPLLSKVENRDLPSDQWAQLCIEAEKG